MMMDDDWNTTGPLEKDIFISEIHNTDRETIDILKLFDNDDGFSDEPIRIKMEPTDETSDYHGSSSGSPSSSLSSPNEFKDEPLGLDINFGSSLFNAPFSPSATSSHMFQQSIFRNDEQWSLNGSAAALSASISRPFFAHPSQPSSSSCDPAPFSAKPANGHEPSVPQA
ncbi:hypothetical protein L5515_014789 [Caenorhabditis briggsae]|uniref:Uncharacterized protein n=1 Tax=Caenorhabditis briggsae TaxID=6238 RepID=A0AAE9DMW7_CAEBR|nr:hypothetical protein L3Y34_018672 [Caenorhabditis briggsae]UMM18971.1 hypothetical protein L5515_014789 [Caenorhabditis briggsae]